MSTKRTKNDTNKHRRDRDRSLQHHSQISVQSQRFPQRIRIDNPFPSISKKRNKREAQEQDTNDDDSECTEKTDKTESSQTNCSGGTENVDHGDILLQLAKAGM
jgi:hypothetical protein